jgi:hypothetical protein
MQVVVNIRLHEYWHEQDKIIGFALGLGKQDRTATGSDFSGDIDTTQYTSNTKQNMGTYAVNMYGWLICKLTLPQRTIESKANMQYIFKIIWL